MRNEELELIDEAVAGNEKALQRILVSVEDMDLQPITTYAWEST